MLPILEDYLRESVPPELFTLYVRADALLEAFDVDNPDLAFQDLLMTADGALDGKAGVVDNYAIHALYDQLLEDLLVQHQIKLNENAPFLFSIQILEFIKQIEQTELIDDSIDVLKDAEATNEERWASLMELVGETSVDESLPYLEEIPAIVIKNTLRYFEDRIRFQTDTAELPENYARLCQEMDLFARTVNGVNMRCYKHLMEYDGVTGMPFAYYWLQNQDYLVGLGLRDMLYECIGFALLSENGLNNPQGEIMAQIATTYSELNFITKAQIELTSILLEYKKEVTSGFARTA